jgi:hypothetical protein
MQDTTITAVNDSIETTLTNISTPYSYYMQAFARYNMKDSTGVLSKLSEVISDFSLSTYETNIHTDFEDYFSIMLALQSVEKHFVEIDSVKKSVLYPITENSHDLAQAYARNLLVLTDELVYHEPYIFPDSSTNKSTRAESSFDVNNIDKEQYLKLYPNPAHDYMTIEFNLPYSSESIIAEIVTIQGKPVEICRLNGNRGEKIVDMRKFVSGTYIVRLWANGVVIESGKFVKN